MYLSILFSYILSIRLCSYVCVFVIIFTGSLIYFLRNLTNQAVVFTLFEKKYIGCVYLFCSNRTQITSKEEGTVTCLFISLQPLPFSENQICITAFILILSCLNYSNFERTEKKKKQKNSLTPLPPTPPSPNSYTPAHTQLTRTNTRLATQTQTHTHQQ